MAMHENVTIQSAYVRITAGTPGAVVDRFIIPDTTVGRTDEVITHVPGAAGAPARGILAMKPDVPYTGPGGAAFSGVVGCGYVRPDGCEAVVELGEAVTAPGQALRVGGNGAEVDGAAYLADASGDYIAGYAKEVGVVGQKIRFEFINAGLVP